MTNHPSLGPREGWTEIQLIQHRLGCRSFVSGDPDGDRLAYRWWQYTDVDSVRAKIDMARAASDSAAGFVVPDEPGRTIHVILEVTDDGSPPLTRYGRIVLTIDAER